MRGIVPNDTKVLSFPLLLGRSLCSDILILLRVLDLVVRLDLLGATCHHEFFKHTDVEVHSALTYTSSIS